MTQQFRGIKALTEGLDQWTRCAQKMVGASQEFGATKAAGLFSGKEAASDDQSTLNDGSVELGM